MLSRSYKKPREQITYILDELFSTPVFIFENHQILLEVLAIYKNSKADFSDLLICKTNELANCQFTMSFDKIAFEQAGMKSPTTQLP